MKEDAISRQAAIDAMAKWDWQELYLPIHFKQLLEDLPSVSTEKTGRWIKRESEIVLFECSVCKDGYIDQPTCMGKPMFKYCPCCGANMVEPQESEG